jgi:N-acetylglucosamine malate deacetylase 1
MNIACIGSHPDDVELAMGGTVLRMKAKGNRVVILDLSDGEPTPYGSIEIRKKERMDSAAILGVERYTLNNKNRYILDSIESRVELAEYFREIKPDVIFTHFHYDVHPDHISACAISDAARFYSKLTKSDIRGEPFFPKKMIYYFPNHIHLNLLPSFCINISDQIDTKIKALSAYDSQFIKKGDGTIIKEIKAINNYYGIRIGKEYAEPFLLRDTLDLDFFKELI